MKIQSDFSYNNNFGATRIDKVNLLKKVNTKSVSDVVSTKSMFSEMAKFEEGQKNLSIKDYTFSDFCEFLKNMEKKYLSPQKGNEKKLNSRECFDTFVKASDKILLKK